jgi:hypothetical protein
MIVVCVCWVLGAHVSPDTVMIPLIRSSSHSQSLSEGPVVDVGVAVDRDTAPMLLLYSLPSKVV